MHILSFDIEEWFHINNSDWIEASKWSYLEKRVELNTKTILSFLKRHNMKASFFVLGWIAEQYPELVAEIVNEGHDIGYHSYFHRIPSNQSSQEFEKDLTTGLKLLEDITKRKIKYYRAPNFSLKNKWMLDCLVDNGIEVSSSIKNPILHKGVNLPDYPFVFNKADRKLVELPLVTKNLLFTKFAYSGSGYFRLLPISLIKKLFNDQTYHILYFHPRDFDKNVPTPKEFGIFRNTLNTIGISSVLPKLEKLTKSFSFISISQALDMMDIDKLERIEY